MTNEKISAADAIRNGQRVYAIFPDGSRDVIYAIAWTKCVGRLRHYQLTEIDNWVIE
jgi:hypothetical protein